ncbi:MAG TPA: hypothetical protein ENK31_04260 [Nannocystis exedens]|nr:hypothetical protein [Nannocystis exedens]
MRFYYQRSISLRCAPSRGIITVQSGERQQFAWRTSREQRTLNEYIAFARERSLSAILDLCLGPIEIGSLTLKRGRLWHAEMPGSSGNTALSLMCKLARVEVQARALRRDQAQTLNGSSEQLFTLPKLTEQSRKVLTAAFEGIMHEAVDTPNRTHEHSAAGDPKRTTTDTTLRLPTIIRGPTKPTRPPLPAPAKTPAETPRTPPTAVPAKTSAKPERLGQEENEENFDALFLRAMRAYGRRDYHSAMKSFERCATLRPGDSRVQHNIDRLRERLGKP